MSDAIAGGALGIAGDMFSNIIGSIENGKNRKFQAEQAQINREWQTQQRNEQNQWNLEQWQRNNEYNTASSQKQRYLDAGINPYLAMAGGGAGAAAGVSNNLPASTTPGAPNMPSSAPFVPNFSATSEILSNMALKAAQTKNIESNTVGTNISNSFAPNLLGNQVKGLKLDNDAKRLSNDLVTATFDQNKEQVQLQNNLLKAQEATTMLDAEAKKTLNKYLDSQQSADLFLKYQNIINMQETAKLTQAQVKEVNSKITLNLAHEIMAYANTGNIQQNTEFTKANTQKVRLDFNIAKNTAQSLINSINAANNYNLLRYNNDSRYFNKLKDDSFGKWLYDQTRFHNETVGNLKIPEFIK